MFKFYFQTYFTLHCVYFQGLFYLRGFCTLGCYHDCPRLIHSLSPPGSTAKLVLATGKLHQCSGNMGLAAHTCTVGLYKSQSWRLKTASPQYHARSLVLNSLPKIIGTQCSLQAQHICSARSGFTWHCIFWHHECGCVDGLVSYMDNMR